MHALEQRNAVLKIPDLDEFASLGLVPDYVATANKGNVQRLNGDDCPGADGEGPVRLGKMS